MEDGKFGDQKYLDDWMTRFDCCHELQHLGGGVAPWNVQQYDVSEGPLVNNYPVVFFHFHALQWINLNYFDLTNYKISRDVIKFLYLPYLVNLKNCLEIVKNTYNSNFTLGIKSKKNILNYFFNNLRFMLSRIKHKTLFIYKI